MTAEPSSTPVIDRAKPTSRFAALDVWAGRAVRWVTVLVLISCLVHLISPLRLNTDAVTILYASLNHVEGRGFTVDSAEGLVEAVYPKPALLMYSGIVRAGLDYPWFFVLLNLLCILIASGAWAFVLRRSLGFCGVRDGTSGLKWWSLFGYVLLSFTLIKHLCIPLTDLPYLAWSSLALAAIVWVDASVSLRGRVLRFLLAVVAVAGAVALRSVGICLLPALVVAFYRLLPGKPSVGPDPLAHLRRWWKLGTAVSFVVASASGIALATQTRYWVQMKDRYEGMGFWQWFDETARQRLTEVGQLVSNVPGSVIPPRLEVAWVALGLIGLVMMLIGRIVLLRTRPAGMPAIQPVDAMAVAFLAIMFLWPYPADTRFWIPQLFWVGGLLVSFGAWVGRFGAGRLMMAAVAVLYVGLGLAAHAQSTRLATASRADFAAAYGTAVAKASYRSAWGLEQPEDGTPPDATWVRVIRHVYRRDP